MPKINRTKLTEEDFPNMTDEMFYVCNQDTAEVIFEGLVHGTCSVAGIPLIIATPSRKADFKREDDMPVNADPAEHLIIFGEEGDCALVDIEAITGRQANCKHFSAHRMPTV